MCIRKNAYGGPISVSAPVPPVPAQVLPAVLRPRVGRAAVPFWTTHSTRFQQITYLVRQQRIVLVDYRMVIPNNWNDLQTFGEQIFPTSSPIGRTDGFNSVDRICTNKNPPASEAAWPINLRDLPIQSFHNFPLQKR